MEDQPQTKKRGFIVPLRINVLLLLALAYGSLFGIFLVLVWNDVAATDAYDRISVPFVALVGGTLAVAKDLIE